MSLSDQAGSADEARRAKLKTAATLRAQFNYKTALERIDHKLDVIEPAMKEVVKVISTVGRTPDFLIVEESDDDSTQGLA